MLSVDARLSRLRKERHDRERRLALFDQAEQLRLEAQAESQSAREIPDVEEWLCEVWGWPNEDVPGELALGINGAQRHYLETCTAWRYDNGTRVFGADIWANARRQRTSSVVRALFAREVMAYPGYIYVQFLEDSTDAKLDPVCAEWAVPVENLPLKAWREGWTFRRNSMSWTYRHPSWPDGVLSVYRLVGAGYSEDTADRRGRAGRIDGVHYSDMGTYRFPRKLFNATSKCVPRRGGRIVAESTMPRHREHWFATQFYATRQQQGRFLEAVWTPWYMAEHLRIPRTNREWFNAAMATDVSASDLDAEQRLDEEQTAYRRWYRCRGTILERREAAREDPEVPEETHELEGEPYWPPIVIDRLRYDVRPPLTEVNGHKGRRRLAPYFSVSVWSLPERLILGIDRAAIQGRDMTACVGLDPTTREQALEMHGRCTDHQLAKAVLEVLCWLLPSDMPRVEGEELTWRHYDKSRVTVVPERNKCIGAIKELELLGVDLYRDTKGRPGLYTTGKSRPVILSCVIEAVDGTEDQRWILRSDYLIDEIESLRPNPKRGNRLEGHPRDDLVVALGEAVQVAKLEEPKKSLASQWAQVSGGSSPPPPFRHAAGDSLPT